MRIYTAGNSDDGFTLIEIIVTVFIISIFLSFSLPNLPDITGYRLKTSSRKLRNIIMFVRNQAIIKKKYFKLTYNIEKNSYKVDEQKGKSFIEFKTVFKTKGVLPPPIEFENVDVAGRSISITGETATFFTPQGFVEKTSIYLKDNSNRKMTIHVHPVSGRVTIHEGFIESGYYR